MGWEDSDSVSATHTFAAIIKFSTILFDYQTYIKEKKDFVADLKETIQGFYKYYQEQNKDKIKQE